MQNLYFDESGSMTARHAQSNPYFVIAMVRPDNPERLRKLYKRFVTKHLQELKSADVSGKMFQNGRFRELKGYALTPQLKKDFAAFFCQKNAFELYYIQIDNSRVSPAFFANTARAFNYVLKLALQSFISRGFLPDEPYCLQLDERNERPDSRLFLGKYLNTELRMNGSLSHDLTVQYFDSRNHRLIQIADVFSNLYYSFLRSGNYSNELGLLRRSNTLRFVFQFPPSTVVK